MWQRIKSAIYSNLQTRRLIIFCLAAYNFISLWFLAKEASESRIQPIVPDWYDPWTFYNEPTVLLIASALLLLNKKQSDFASAMLSGYIFFHGLYVITFRISWSDWLYSWINVWEVFLSPKMVFDYWGFQIIFSLIVFFLSGFYLIQPKSDKSFH